MQVNVLAHFDLDKKNSKPAFYIQGSKEKVDEKGIFTTKGPLKLYTNGEWECDKDVEFIVKKSTRINVEPSKNFAKLVYLLNP